jgi:hypothetical protein
MVRVFCETVFVDDYGLTINMDTNLGLIIFQTNFPRLNKRITVGSICSFEIRPGIKIDYVGLRKKIPVRDSQQFLHKTIMTIGEGVLYHRDSITKRIIKRYRREHGGT